MNPGAVLLAVALLVTATVAVPLAVATMSNGFLCTAGAALPGGRSDWSSTFRGSH